ncbi:MerR family transcriptional regulator [Streptomyces beihaiensis]|uniref:MerR family transcriptional regulator n=1 Tax=Streptomyces beihaiensis TaxID=2984495 RepID=A0ABT3TQI6_9ACTN|nr:MerR family transcriptional regulator [Streptomyces beihaiensis]MCX3058707.1 MerR family transcriptional regulator [Streptomyces beihaiensis]
MRIGELAGIVGVTTRAIRHYHHLGLLPEPERLGNGYREYGARHAVELARIRRLTELGLGLAEVRDVLADDAGRDLVEVLGELDADLARQEREIRERRERLRTLLSDAERGRLPAEGPVSGELAELFGGELGQLRGESAMAAKDREFLALVDTNVSPEAREELMSALRPSFEDPAALATAREVYARFDALADVAPDDPRVGEAARALSALLPSGAPATPRGDAVGGRAGALLDSFLADLSPAQAEAVRLALRATGQEEEGGAE